MQKVKEIQSKAFGLEGLVPDDTVFKPILFSTPMVQANLRGDKTETRRLCKFGKAYDIFHDGKHEVPSEQTIANMLPCKYSVRDILWCRETFQHTKCLNINPEDENYGYVYRADQEGKDFEENIQGWKWKPNIFMPKDACRMFLRVKSIVLERLNDITREGAIAEGVEHWYEKHHFCERYKDYSGITNGFFDKKDRLGCSAPEASYNSLWAKINGFDSLNANPFVWVIKFERVIFDIKPI